MKALVCVDNDLRYEDVLGALGWCLNLGDDDEVLVTHVFPTLRFMGRSGDLDPGWSGWERKIIEKARAFITETAGRIEHGRAHPFLLEGDVASEIVAAGVEHGVDVIVLGAVGQARSQDFLVGSVAEKVMEASSRDLLLVRGAAPESAEQFRALVALDGSEASFESVESFARKTRASKAVIRLLHVVETPPATFDVDLNDDRDSEGISDRKKAFAEQTFDRAREILRTHGLEAEPLYRRGPAASEILDVARVEHANLIVVSRRGLGLSGPLGGSVARRVARHAACSVWVAESSKNGETAGA